MAEYIGHFEGGPIDGEIRAVQFPMPTVKIASTPGERARYRTHDYDMAAHLPVYAGGPEPIVTHILYRWARWEERVYGWPDGNWENEAHPEVIEIITGRAS